MGSYPDIDIDPGFVLQTEGLTFAGPLNIFVPFLVSWALGIFCASIELYIYIYIYIYNPHSNYNGNRTEWSPTD